MAFSLATIANGREWGLENVVCAFEITMGWRVNLDVVNCGTVNCCWMVDYLIHFVGLHEIL